MQPRRPGADAPPVLQTQPKLSKFTLRGLLTLPYRLCNPPPAVGKVRSFGLTPIFQVKLEDVLDRKHLPPLGLKDFEEWLLFVEQCPENLYFILWLREYTAKYDAWAAKVRAREEKERAKETRRARPRTCASKKGSGGRTWRKGTATAAKGRDGARREMADVLEVDEENELDAEEGDNDDDDDEFDFDRRPRGRGYRVTWTASAAYSPSLALFFTRARETFFSPASAYELVVPPELLSPFFVGSVSVASPGPPDFSSFSPSSPSSSSSSSPISPHPHPHPLPHLQSQQHTPSFSCSNPGHGLGLPYPLPHPDPAVFAPLQAHIERRLQLSLQRFVRAAYTNVGTFRATCGILAGCFALCVGCVPPLALAFASPPSSSSSSSSASSPSFVDSDVDTMRRWKRLYALPAMWLGLTLILASLRGVCLMVYVFGDFRQLRRFELERPPPPPLGVGIGASGPGSGSGEKKLPNALLQPPPAAYTGAGDAHGRHSAFVLPTAMSASAYVSHTFTASTGTSTSTTSSASSYPAPGAAAGTGVPPMQVRALTAPPKISIRIPPARGHLQGHEHAGGRGRGGLAHGHGHAHAHAHAQRGQRPGSNMSASASGDTTRNSHSDAEPDAHTISISSTRKSGLGMRAPFGDDYHDDNNNINNDSDSDSDCEDGDARGRSVRRIVLESDLDSEFDDGEEDEGEEEDEEEDDNGIYISPLMPPPEEAAENDPAVFSAALALVAQAKAKAGLTSAGVSETDVVQRTEGASGEQAAERGLNPQEKEREKCTAPTSTSTVNPNLNPNPNPTASFIPAFPYGVYQGTEEVDPWPASACVSVSASGSVARAGTGAAGGGGVGGPAGRRPHSARREREPASPVTDRGPCWSVKKSRPGSRPGTGRSARSRSRSSRGGLGEKGERDIEKNAVDSAACSDADDGGGDDSDAGAGASGRKAERTALPKLPMGAFDFDALPPVTRTPPQHLLHHLNHSHNQSLTHSHKHHHAHGVPDLEKGMLARGLGYGADVDVDVDADARLPTAAVAVAVAGVPESERAGSVHTPSTLAALFALLPVRFPSVSLPTFLRSRSRRRAPSSSTNTFGDPYTAHLPPHAHAHAHPNTHVPRTAQAQSHAYTYTYACPASPASTLGPRSGSRFGGYSYGDGAASKGWRRAYAHVQRTPAFGPVTRVLSPVVSRAQWEIVVRAFFVAGLLTCVVEAALVALPARW